MGFFFSFNEKTSPMKFYLFTMFIFFYSIGASQINGLGKEPKPIEGLKLESFGYPVFLGGEQHASFHLTYPFSSTFSAKLNSFYDTYLLSNRFRANILLKKYLDENWYLFSGIESEFNFNKYQSIDSQKQSAPRIGILSGIGYEVNRSIQVEAKGNLQINNSSLGPFGEPLVPMPQMYSLKGKIKF